MTSMTPEEIEAEKILADFRRHVDEIQKIVSDPAFVKAYRKYHKK
jgi:hypothetical protein